MRNWTEYLALMEGVHLTAALKQAMSISSLGNQLHPDRVRALTNVSCNQIPLAVERS